MTHTFLILAGIGNSGPLHWQSHWQSQLPNAVKLDHAEWERPDRHEWEAELRAKLKSMEGTVTLVAHSLACLLVAHWAAQADARVTGALLVSVPDPAGPAFPAAARNFQDVPMKPLPFRSAVVSSTNDGFGSAAYQKACAEAWGARFHSVGPLGHINADSGLGTWTEGIALLREL